MTAQQLDARMTEMFGADWRRRSVCGWPLRDAFDECGLRDPLEVRAEAPPLPVTPFQILTTPVRRSAFDPVANAKAAARYMRERYGAGPWKAWEER